MKEFLKTKTITYNLLSFSGFKMLMLFSILIEGPKTFEEIKERFSKHELLRETLTRDTFRVYLNSLKEFGCEVARTNKNRDIKYSITTHPFEMRIEESQIKDLIKVFKTVVKSIDLEDLILLTDFFDQISCFIKNDDLKYRLAKISPFFNIDKGLFKALQKACNNKEILHMYYASPKSGNKVISVESEDLYVYDGVLYVSGTNLEHGNFFRFPIKKIIQLLRTEPNTKIKIKKTFNAKYFYKFDDNDEFFEKLPNEKIVKKKDDGIVVEISSKNKFDVFQRVLYLSPRCRVMSPDNFRDEIIETIKQMRGLYSEEK